MPTKNEFNLKIYPGKMIAVMNNIIVLNIYGTMQCFKDLYHALQ